MERQRRRVPVQQRLPCIAGSLAVHMVGGILALLGAIFIGPRRGAHLGRSAAGSQHDQRHAGHVYPVVRLVWEPTSGSTLSASDPGLMGLVALNTTIAAAAGSAAAMFFAYFRSGKWNASHPEWPPRRAGRHHGGAVPCFTSSALIIGASGGHCGAAGD
ncbi:MAG: hypothetical protein U0703_18445 [Anaerolineae bacterium]